MPRSHPHRHATARPTAAALLAITAVVLITGLASNALSDDTVDTCTAKPFVVKIHADWCSTCKVVSSVWTQIDEEMGDDVQIVVLDVSDRVAFSESKATAERLGLAEFFREYRSRTGTIAILDCRSFEPVAILSGERDIAKYREAITRARRSS